MKISITKPQFSVEISIGEGENLQTAIDSIETIMEKAGEKPIKLEDVLSGADVVAENEEDLELPFCPECNHPFDSCICTPERPVNNHTHGRIITGNSLVEAIRAAQSRPAQPLPVLNPASLSELQETRSRELPQGIIPLNIDSILSQPVEGHSCECETPCETCSCEHQSQEGSFSSEFNSAEEIPARTMPIAQEQPRSLTLGEVLGLPVDANGSILGGNNADLNEAVSRISEALRRQ